MINRFKWLEIKPETRRNLVVYLNSTDGFPKIVHTGQVEVVNNKVVCDGFTDKDLCAITPELLQAALGPNTLIELGIDTGNLYDMFYELVRRLELPPIEITPETMKVVSAALQSQEPDKKKSGRPKKNIN